MSCQRNASCGLSAWVNAIQQQAQGFLLFFLFFFCSQSPFVTTVLWSFLKTIQEGSEDLQHERKRHLLHLPPEAGGQGAGANSRGYGNVPQQCDGHQQPPAQLRCCRHRHISAKISSVLTEPQQCLFLSQLCLKRLESLLQPVWWCELGPGASKVFA